MSGSFPIDSVMEGLLAGLPGFATDGHPDIRAEPRPGDRIVYRVRLSRREEYASFDAVLTIASVDGGAVDADVELTGEEGTLTGRLSKPYADLVYGVPAGGLVPMGHEELPTAFGPRECEIAMYANGNGTYIAWLCGGRAYRTIFDRAGFRYYVDVTSSTLLRRRSSIAM